MKMKGNGGNDRHGWFPWFVLRFRCPSPFDAGEAVLLEGFAAPERKNHLACHVFPLFAGRAREANGTLQSLTDWHFRSPSPCNKTFQLTLQLQCRRRFSIARAATTASMSPQTIPRPTSTTNPTTHNKQCLINSKHKKLKTQWFSMTFVAPTTTHLLAPGEWRFPPTGRGHRHRFRHQTGRFVGGPVLLHQAVVRLKATPRLSASWAVLGGQIGSASPEWWSALSTSFHVCSSSTQQELKGISLAWSVGARILR